MRPSWPLTGRSEELHVIEAAIAAPEVAGVLVRGPAGVGKSRLVREALSAAAARGCVDRWAVASTSAQTIPLGAFVAWVPASISDMSVLLRGLIGSLTASSAGTPVVLCVDDVHLLDDLSAFVVHHIVQHRAATVILTMRSDAPIPAAVQEIWIGNRFEILDLLRLPLESTATLVSATLRGPVDPDAAEQFWTLTDGNTLYLRNIVEQELADGRLAERNGLWRWSGDPTIPPGLVELIESRMGDLPPVVDDVVDVLAVAEPIRLASLRRIVDPAAIEEAETRGLITVETSGSDIEVRVAHPLYGEVRRRRAPVTRLRRLRGLVVDELASSGDPDDLRTVVRRAALRLDSDLPPDVDLLATAARGAVWLADLPLAEQLSRAAVGAGAGPEMNLVRAHALSWMGHGRRAADVLDSIASDSLSDQERARLAFIRASNMLWAVGDPAEAGRIIDGADRTAPADARTAIDAFRAVYWFAVDRPDLVEESAKGLVVLDLPGIVGAELAAVRVAVAADAGRTDDAVTIADAGYVVARRSLDAPQMRLNIVDAQVTALLLAGRIADAVHVAEHERREAATLPGVARSIGVAVGGRAALGAGKLCDASTLLAQATDSFSAAGHSIGWGYRYRIPQALALAMRGRISDATTVLIEVARTDRPFRHLDYELSLARAWVSAGQGVLSEAIATAVAAAERCAAKGQFAAEALCLQTATQFGDRSCGVRLRALEGIVEGPRAAVAARFAEALHDGDPAELIAVSKDFEQLGDIVAAVDAAAQAALVYRHLDLRGSSLSAAARATALADDIDADTPALRQAREPVPFTDREREIVLLVGAGLSNRQIAERLTLSVRTVESHIYRAMAKTGTTRRESLAATLGVTP
ncbi:LuxR C-terminal-related transcriptional regulator [Gordonia sp. NPDC003424]